MQMMGILAMGLIWCSLSVAAEAQVTVDAAVPIRKLRWETHGASGTGNVDRIPLSVTVERLRPAEAASGPTKVEFTLTNTGNTDFEVPISPQPADLEPNDPNIEYRVTSLGLYVLKASGPPALKGGAILYGKPDAPGTMLRLLPGQSIRVLANVWFPQTEETSPAFQAIASEDCTTFRKQKGRRVSDSHGVGSAFSNDFTLSSLPLVSPPSP